MGLPTRRYACSGGRTVRSMASKSANYCGTSRERNEGILLLRSVGPVGLYAYRPNPTAGAIVAHVHCGCEGSPAEVGCGRAQYSRNRTLGL
jgi:hypothetical protein